MLRISPLIFGTAIMAGMMFTPAAKAATGWAVVAVNMRTCASVRCPRILTIPEGARLWVHDCDIWCDVDYRDRRGFVYGRYIAFDGYRGPIYSWPPVYTRPPIYIVPPIYEPPPYYRPPPYYPPPPRYRPPPPPKQPPPPKPPGATPPQTNWKPRQIPPPQSDLPRYDGPFVTPRTRGQ